MTDIPSLVGSDPSCAPPTRASLPPLEHRDGLEVVRVWEDIERAQASQSVARVAQRLRVAGEGYGVAGHVDDVRRGQLNQLRGDIAASAGSRWIEHHGATAHAIPNWPSGLDEF